jgi:hypothetical protein
MCRYLYPTNFLARSTGNICTDVLYICTYVQGKIQIWNWTHKYDKRLIIYFWKWKGTFKFSVASLFWSIIIFQMCPVMSSWLRTELYSDMHTRTTWPSLVMVITEKESRNRNSYAALGKILWIYRCFYRSKQILYIYFFLPTRKHRHLKIIPAHTEITDLIIGLPVT